MTIRINDNEDETDRMTQRFPDQIDDIDDVTHNSKLSNSVNVYDKGDKFVTKTSSPETTASTQTLEKHEEGPKKRGYDIKQLISHSHDAPNLISLNDTKEKYIEHPMQNDKGKLQRESVGTNGTRTNKTGYLWKIYIYLIYSVMQIQQVIGTCEQGRNTHQSPTIFETSNNTSYQDPEIKLIDFTIQKPFIYGKVGRLSCWYAGEDKVEFGKRIWKKDSFNRLLAIENGTCDPRKFKTLTLENGTRSDLVIKNISLSDFGHIYTCYFGFQCWDINLTMDLAQFEKYPDENDFNKTIYLHDHNFTVVIRLIDVHPEPSCNFTCGTYGSNLNINQELKKVDELFTKRWIISSVFNSTTSPFILNMSCTIGSHPFIRRIVIRNETYEQVDEENSKDTVIIVILILGTLIVGITCLHGVMYKFRKCLRSHHRPQNENQKIDSEEMGTLMLNIDNPNARPKNDTPHVHNS